MSGNGHMHITNASLSHTRNGIAYALAFYMELG